MGYPQNFRRDPNLKPKWLEEKLAKPEEWSVRDRDDIVYFIEKKREQLTGRPSASNPFGAGARTYWSAWRRQWRRTSSPTARIR